MFYQKKQKKTLSVGWINVAHVSKRSISLLNSVVSKGAKLLAVTELLQQIKQSCLKSHLFKHTNVRVKPEQKLPNCIK